MIVCEPTSSALVVSVAAPPATARMPSDVAPSKNSTLPAAAGLPAAAVTRNVNVTLAPVATGLASEVSCTAGAPSTT